MQSNIWYFQIIEYIQIYNSYKFSGSSNYKIISKLELAYVFRSHSNLALTFCNFLKRLRRINTHDTFIFFFIATNIIWILHIFILCCINNHIFNFLLSFILRLINLQLLIIFTFNLRQLSHSTFLICFLNTN